MKRKIIFFLLQAMLLVAMICHAAPQGTDTQDQRCFKAGLTETLEGTSRECVQAVFCLTENGGAVHYSLAVNNVDNITMAHLHFGKAGEIGSPVVWLYPPSPPPKLIPGTFSGVLYEGDFTAADFIGPLRGHSLDALIRGIEQGRVYVNIHTTKHPESAISGMVKPF